MLPPKPAATLPPLEQVLQPYIPVTILYYRGNRGNSNRKGGAATTWAYPRRGAGGGAGRVTSAAHLASEPWTCETLATMAKTGPKGPTRFTEAPKEAAVTFVRDHGFNAGGMAVAAGVSGRTVLRYLQEDEDFRAQVEDAKGEFLGILEDEARRRAVEGWIQEEQFGEDGALRKQVRKFSDPLLLHLMKANGPGKHRDSVKVETSVSGTVDHKHTGRIDVNALPDDKRRLVRQLLAEDATPPSDN